MEKKVWDKLTALGAAEKARRLIEDAGKDLAEYGYQAYTADYLVSILAQGVEDAGVVSNTEFVDGEVLALAYLLGLLAGKKCLEREA